MAKKKQQMVYILRISAFGNLQFLFRWGQWRNVKHLGRMKPMLFPKTKVPPCYTKVDFEIKAWVKA